MDRHHDELELVVELTRVAEANRELAPLLEWIVQRTTALLAAADGSIKLLSDPEVFRTFVRTPGGSAWPPVVTLSIGGYIAKTQQPLASPDVLNDPRFPGFDRTECRVRAVLAAPLKVENQVIGMLAVSERQPGRRWTPRDARLLGMVAAHAAEAVQRVRYREKAVRYREQVAQFERDLADAGELQAALLPREPLRCGGWEIEGRVITARRVGGDYFGYCPLGPGRFAVSVADVTGKGMPAALLVSKFDTLVRAFCDGRRPLPEAFEEVNRSLIEQVPPRNNITSFYAEVDHRRGLLRYVRAGHCYPLVRRSGPEIEALSEGDAPLGAFPDTKYREFEHPFAPGDALLLYTDGVTEAMSPENEFFGDERLIEAWRSCAGRSAAESIGCVLHEVERFRGAGSQSDDIAIVAVAPTRG